MEFNIPKIKIADDTRQYLSDYEDELNNTEPVVEDVDQSANIENSEDKLNNVVNDSQSDNDNVTNTEALDEVPEEIEVPEVAPLTDYIPKDQDSFSPDISNINDAIKRTVPIGEFFKGNTPDGYDNYLNSFYPIIEPEISGNGTDDISLNVIEYLKSIGYKYCIWQLNREGLSKEDKHSLDWDDCQCDENQGQIYSIDDLEWYAEEYATEKGFYPPAPIYAMAAHPHCNCSLVFYKDQNFNSIDDIPDNCPGLPMFAKQSVLDEEKTKILSILPDTIVVSAQTVYPPLDFFNTMRISSYKLYSKKAIKQAEVSEWDSSIKPITIKNDFVYLTPIGIWYVIKKGLVGFQIKISGSKVKIYLSQYNCILTTSVSNIEYVSLTESNSEDLAINSFILCDNKLALAAYKYKSHLIAYYPEDNKLKPVLNDYAVLMVARD